MESTTKPASTMTRMPGGAMVGRFLTPLAKAAVLAGLLVAQAGCATHVVPCVPQRSAPLSWAELPPGPIGLITTSTLPLFRVVYPMPRDQAADQGGERAFCLAGRPALIVMMVIPPLTPHAVMAMGAAGVAGNLTGACRGVPEQRLTNYLGSFWRAEGGIDFQRELSGELFRRLERQLGRPLAAVPKPLPPISPAECRRMASLQAGTLAWLPENVTASEYLARVGVETLLEIRLRNPGLRGHAGINPSLSLGADVEVRLIRLRDARVLARATATYDSRTHPFPHWARDEGRALREEFARCCEKLGHELARSLLEAFDGPAPVPPTGNLVLTP